MKRRSALQHRSVASREAGDGSKKNRDAMDGLYIEEICT
jgi:hypothetical protein